MQSTACAHSRDGIDYGLLLLLLAAAAGDTEKLAATFVSHSALSLHRLYYQKSVLKIRVLCILAEKVRETEKW